MKFNAVTDRVLQFWILYPEQKNVSASWIISMAKDRLANDYMESNLDAPDEAIQENSRCTSLLEAMDILSDSGDVTFSKDARELAESLVD